jgi:hypothetical protein
VRIAGWLLVLFGAVVAIPPLSLRLFFAIEEVFRHRFHDEQGIVGMLCLLIAGLGTCVSGIGGLMVWVGRTGKP